MLHSAHIRQPRTARALSRPLNNFYALDERAVHFVPHFHAHAGELAAEQDCGVDASAADVDAYAGEGVACAEPHEEDVAYACAFRVVFCEEAGSGAGGVEEGGLRGCDCGDGVGAGFFDVGGCWGEDGDAEMFAF